MLRIISSGNFLTKIPASILYKSIAGRYRPVSYPDGPITVLYRFIKNAYWDINQTRCTDMRSVLIHFGVCPIIDL